MTPHSDSPDGRGPLPISSLALLALRVVTGGVLTGAAFFKLRGPQTFSEAIQAFKYDLPDHLVMVGTYVIPWTELFIGLALILGIWTRAAAFLYSAAMAFFIVLIVDALGRDLGGTPCGCFGSWYLFCKGGLGWCKVGENGVLLALGLLVWGFGGGRLSVDALVDRRFRPI